MERAERNHLIEKIRKFVQRDKKGHLKKIKWFSSNLGIRVFSAMDGLFEGLEILRKNDNVWKREKKESPIFRELSPPI